MIDQNVKTKVSGSSVYIISKAMGTVKQMAIEILKKHGFTEEISANDWVSLPEFINALQEIQDRFGPSTMFNIGKTVPEIIPFPEQIKTFEEAMKSINYQYMTSHKGMAQSSKYYLFTKINNGKAQMSCNNPYPLEFDRGLISGMARKFPPEKARSLVKVDVEDLTKLETENRVYNITWST